MTDVLILSGGLDSTVLLYRLIADNAQYYAIHGHHKEGGPQRRLHLLSFDYGQRHIRELDAARRFARDTASRRLHGEYKVANMFDIGRTLLGGSSQTSTVPVPEGHYQDASMRLTVVPNRNMIMLAVAAGWAMSLAQRASGGARQPSATLYYAAHAGDHAIYPDCRPAFANAMRAVLANAGYERVELHTPFISYTKAQIVREGATLGAPMGDTWSCYKGGDLHCGKCGTCVERIEAFKVAGVEDETGYETDV